MLLGLPRPRRARLIAAGLLCGSVALAGCGGSSTPAAAPSESASPSATASPSAMPTTRDRTTTAVLQLGRLPFEKYAASAGQVPGWVDVRPASPGSAVVVQQKKGGTWQQVASGEQDDRGRTSFSLASTPSAQATFRAVTSSPRGSVVSAPVSVSRAWRKIWGDEFDGDALDPGSWRTREQPPTGRRLCSSPDSSLVSVQDGAAVLGIKRVQRATKDCPHGVFKNAMIGTGEVTQPGFTATYGLFAARVKFQSGKGQHGAFWLQGAGPGAAEIDVAEYYGDGGAGVTTLVHHYNPDGTVDSAGGVQKTVPEILGTGNTPSNGWHVWSVEWSPSGYVFRLDDQITLRTKKYVSDQQEFMVLSLLTSDWELPALDTTSSTMAVDWVRVWQHPAS